MDCNSILRKYTGYLLIIFNFLFVLTGVVILSVGASVKAYYNEYSNFLNSKYFYASDLLMIIGIVIFIIAFFGFCGALKENACMTTIFSTLLIIILILEILVGVGGLLLKYQTNEVIEEALNKSMLEYKKPNETEITQLWDTMQKDFRCCGINNYTDWSKDNYLNGMIPMSCCHFSSGTLGNETCSVDNKHAINKMGCLEAFSDYIEGHAISIESIGLSFAIIQLLGIILSCYLSKQIRSDYETV